MSILTKYFNFDINFDSGQNMQNSNPKAWWKYMLDYKYS